MNIILKKNTYVCIKISTGQCSILIKYKRIEGFFSEQYFNGNQYVQKKAISVTKIF